MTKRKGRGTGRKGDKREAERRENSKEMQHTSTGKKLEQEALCEFQRMMPNGNIKLSTELGSHNAYMAALLVSDLLGHTLKAHCTRACTTQARKSPSYTATWSDLMIILLCSRPGRKEAWSAP